MHDMTISNAAEAEAMVGSGYTTMVIFLKTLVCISADG
jgi:hypothetical protein